MAKPLCVRCRKPVGQDRELLAFGGEKDGEPVVLETWEPLHPRCADELRRALDHALQDAGEDVDHFILRGPRG